MERTEHFGMPDGFDFSCGSDVDNARIREWVDHAIKHLERFPAVDSYISRSGNALVVADRNSEESIYKYRVFVTKNYVEFSREERDLKHLTTTQMAAPAQGPST